MHQLQRGGYDVVVAAPGPGAGGGRVRVPPSKSYTHRALLAALLASGGVVEGALLSWDTGRTLGVVEALGGRPLVAEDERWRARIVVSSSGLSWSPCLDAGESGTTMRLATGVVALLDKPVLVYGSGRLHERPVRPLLEALARLGAWFTASGSGGCCPPHAVKGPIGSGETWVDAGESSQYLSALLLAGAGVEGGLGVRVVRLESRPYVDVTVQVLEAFGGVVERRGYEWFHVEGPLRPTVYSVPGDWSSAAHIIAAAVAAGVPVAVEGLDPDDPQPDRAIVPHLESMGTSVAWEKRVLEVEPPSVLRPVEACLRDSPDLAPVLAALAGLACGVSHICCIERLRLKESDRVEALVDLLGRAGIEAHAGGGCITVRGSCGPPRPRGALPSHGDHRVAMAAAVLAAASGKPARIAGAHVVAKSYPGFWDDLASLGFHVEKVEG